MDESACLLRSFSDPSDVSREVKEGDPIRALTESISFGRFMSESLAWEKWSTFSNNRYMEEVEKFSKPGSVAQKKAFFEAHFKKRAAMREAALLDEASIVTNDYSKTGSINAASVDPLLDADLANSNESPKDVSYAEIASTAGVDACNLSVVRENIDVSDAGRGLPVMEEDVNMEECRQVENSKDLESGDIHGKIMATPKIPSPLEESSDSKNSTSPSKKRRTSSSSKSSIPNKASSKLPLHPSKRVALAHARSDANVAKPTRNSVDKKKTIPNSLPVSNNFAGKTNKTSLRTTSPQTPTRALKKAVDQENLAPSSEKRNSNSASKLPNHVRVSKQATSRIGNNHALINKKPALDPNEQRRATQKSLHMSMNFSPRPRETNKISPKISRESSTPPKTSTSASVNGGSKHASKVLQSRDKITISVVNKSVSATGDGRWPSRSNCLKSSNSSGTSTRSSITSCPFSFRSEERAAKRKEFFKKLEDKMDSKEAEKSQMQIKSKEKAKNDMTKLRQSTDVKARPNQDSCRGSQSSHNFVKKISSSRPQSPKLGRKPSPSTVQDTNLRPPRRPSINIENSKNGLMKNNRIPCSGTSLPKNRHENASSNIQLTVAKRSISYKHEHGGSAAGGCNR